MLRNCVSFAAQNATQQAFLNHFPIYKSHESDRGNTFILYHPPTIIATSSIIDKSWGGRGRKFKSCHSDQNRRFSRTSDFLYSIRLLGRLGGSLRKALFSSLLHSFSGPVTQFATQLRVSWERIWLAVARSFAIPRPFVLRSPDVRAMVLVLLRSLLHSSLKLLHTPATHFGI